MFAAASSSSIRAGARTFSRFVTQSLYVSDVHAQEVPAFNGDYRGMKLLLGPYLSLMSTDPALRQKLYNFASRGYSVNLLQTRQLSNASIALKTDDDVVRFSFGKPADGCVSARKQKKMKWAKKSRKAKLNELRFYRLKAKKKINSPNPEVRIRYKLEKAKRKEAWLIEKLRKFDVPKAPGEVYDPEILTEEEKRYLKRTGEKKKNYVPVGRRGVFGGVVLNMHLHWKKHETVKVICKPCKPGQVHEYAEELARLSKGIAIDIKPNNTIIFYRGKNYVQPEVMSPPDTLLKDKALEKYQFEQSLEHTSQFIEKLEKELEEYHEHLARYRKEKQQTVPISGDRVYGNCEIDRQKLVEIFSKRSLEELDIIRKTYTVVFGRDLLYAISVNQRSIPLCRVTYMRLSEPKTRDAEILRSALFGGSSNLNTVIEIICSRSSSELHGIKEHYRSHYQSDVEKDVSMKISGSFSEILVAICKSGHGHKYKADLSMALCDAKTLYGAVESGKTLDQRTITTLLSRRNTAQIKEILLSYKKLYGHEFSRLLKNPSKCGQFGRELRVVIRCIQNPEKFFAKQLKMKNADAREMLIRVVITRSGLDIRGVNEALAAKRAGSLENIVRREFGSSSKKDGLVNEVAAAILLELIKA